MTTLRMKRRDLALLGCAALVLPKARGATGASWRLATGYRADSFHGANIASMVAAVNAATQGELAIEVHANNSLVKLSDIRDAVQRGQIEIGETIMTSMASNMPITGADSVPFITNSFADAHRMWRHQRPVVERCFAERGLKVLYAVPWPPQGLYTDKPVTGVRDLRGTRMRTYNATTARIATLVGAQGVDVPMVDVGRAMAERRIDNMITSAVTGVENKVWEHVRYFHEINAWFPKNLVFVNAKAFASLSPKAQQTLMAAAAAAEQRGWEASIEAASTSVETLRSHGMKIERVSSAFSTDIKRLGERFSLEWIRQVGPQANEVFIPYFTRQV